jgi:SAM-dependent methyltransferase
MFTIFAKIFKKIRHGSIFYFTKGIFSSLGLMRLRKKFGFDRWHISPKEFRPYALDIIRYINSTIDPDGTVVEIGCGLGEIIRNIKARFLFGYDTSEPVITAASQLDKKAKVVFKIGSFTDVKKMKIDFLITVNFIHEISSSELRNLFEVVCSENDIHYLLVDYIKGEGYPFTHDHSVIPENYLKVYESGLYEFDRKIVVYEKE